MFLSRGDRDLGVAFQTHPGLDKYKTNNAPPISDEEREDLIAEMAAINATLAAQNKE